jgi:hypothetical protein
MTGEPEPRPIITLLTDFGTRDHYVASLKGVILGLNPNVTLVDLSHEVPPQDVTAGAFVLAEAAPYFPPGTIHLAVVDPGVGTSRRGLAARCREQYWVGPDNGLFHFVFAGQHQGERYGFHLPDCTIVSLETPVFFRQHVSATFHGRDVFAPVAAHLSLGVELGQLGPLLPAPVPLPIAEPTFTPEVARGEVIYIDRFGNLITNLATEPVLAWLGSDRPFRLQAGGIVLRRLSPTYAEVGPGEPLALMGSHGYLEVAVNQGNAAKLLKAKAGLPVAVYLEGPGLESSEPPSFED